ncbi:MAG: protein kinase [Planctomycetota bacterium]
MTPRDFESDERLLEELPRDLPTLWGPFEVLNILGRGGMGVVYRARPVAGGPEVALKVNVRADAMWLARFEREGQLVARLRHPGIVRVHSAGELGGLLYIAYAYVEGARTLGDLLAEGLERERALDLVQEAAEAVAYAHSQGVVHRDLKPETGTFELARAKRGRARR